jgi:hypothetical protein
MSQLAQQHQALNLSQGFPEFDCPPELAELVGAYTRRGFNQYAPMAGLAALREKISRKTQTAAAGNPLFLYSSSSSQYHCCTCPSPPASKQPCMHAFYTSQRQQ